jgi:predicted HAD superfamily Cof-like phosphohydrolase
MAEKKSSLQMVLEFHEAYDCPAYKTPTLPDYKMAYEEVGYLFEALSKKFKDSKNNSRTFLRMKLIFEEFKELCEAMRDGDFVGIVDGLCDLRYVADGTAWEFGVAELFNEAIAEVHRSNMSKLGTDGKPIYREDGKVLKGPNFTPPNLITIIQKYTDSY